MKCLIAAIDPGTTQSALVIVNPNDWSIVRKELSPNEVIEETLGQIANEVSDYRTGAIRLVLEMVASYGMPVGRDVFETVYWTGRFAATWDRAAYHASERIYRSEVKSTLCRSMRAKDSNIRAALIDRWGGDEKKAKGTKKEPGPLYGFKRDLWQALAVAVTYHEQRIRDFRSAGLHGSGPGRSWSKN